MQVRAWHTLLFSLTCGLAMGDVASAQDRGPISMPPSAFGAGAPGSPVSDGWQGFPTVDSLMGGPGYGPGGPGGPPGFGPGGPGFADGPTGGPNSPLAVTPQAQQSFWPKISPFEHRFNQHVNEGGLWMERINDSPRKRFANLDFLNAQMRRPENTFVGEPRAARFAPEAPLTPLSPFNPIDTGAFFSGVLTPSITFGEPFVDPAVVNERTEDNDRVFGFRASTGYEDPDGSGLTGTFFYVPQAYYSWGRGFGASGLNDTNLVVTAGLPLDDGTIQEVDLNGGGTDFIGGVQLVFDRFFQIDFEQQTLGGSLNWHHSPLFERKSLTVKPSTGFQYQYIDEEFGITGADSGNLGPPFRVHFQGGRIIPGSFLANQPPSELKITSEANTHLLGPQIGLKVQFGGDDFLRVVSESHVGAAFLHERLKVFSRGVGAPNLADGITPNPLFNPNLEFTDKQSHTRFVPTANHQVNVELRAFKFVPVLRRMSLFEEATIRLGYSITAAFYVTRPHRNIVFMAQPGVPHIRTDRRSEWYTEAFNVGVHWDW